MDKGDDILEYYRRELGYLRAQGEDFARRYPKVARRLAFNGAESPDPHVERLIESVAFLGARVHRELDREFPQIASALLENLCPSLVRPIPSITVAQLKLDPGQGKVTAGLPVARGSMLQALSASGETCRFQVAWDTVLWPLQVVAARRTDTRVVRIEFEAFSGIDLAELELDRLRLHLHGELLNTMPLQEMMLGSLEDVVLDAAGSRQRLGPSALVECGFDDGQEVIARPAHGHPAYTLLQEYFVFPRKFQFFDLTGLRGRLGSGSSFAVELVFSHGGRGLASVGADTFQLGCVPIVNLFPMVTEPIRLDPRRHEYLLVADRQREPATEIHSIESVIVSDPDAERPRRIAAFSAADDIGAVEPDLYWISRREASLRQDISGTDLFIAFVDRTDVHRAPDHPVAWAEVMCTNRRLAEQVPGGARLVGSGLSGSVIIRTLYEPSLQRDPVMAGEALWSLVSLLRLNHRSLVDGTTGVQTLRDMLLLFAGDSARDQTQVRGIRSLRARPGTARVGSETWRGHCRGTDVTLEFDASAFAGDSPLVLAAVLARFFALYTTANSFVRVSVERNGEPWVRWPALSGRQCVI